MNFSYRHASTRGEATLPRRFDAMAVPDFVELFSPAPSPFLLPPIRGGLDFQPESTRGGGGAYAEYGALGFAGGDGGGEFEELPGIEYPGAG